MIVLIVVIVVLETGRFHVVLAFYVSKTEFACLHIQAKFSGQNKKKNRERRPAGLRFDRIHEKLNYPNRFTDNIEKKIRDDLFFLLKQQVWGRGGFTVSRNFSRELEFDLPRIKLRHIIFHAALIHLLKIYFKVQYYW